LVSVEQDIKREVQHIIHKINEALTEIGEEPYSQVDEVKAIFIVAMQEGDASCTMIGRTSPAEVMLAVLSALAYCKIISLDFGKAVLYAWMKADEPPKE
jgi:hypothetical protein